MSKSIFLTRQIPEIAVNKLVEHGYTVDVNPLDQVLTQKELLDSLSKKPYDAILSLLTDHIDKDVFLVAPSVKIISNYASGFDNIDINEAKERGVVVANSPAMASGEAVAEHTIALMLSLANRIVEADLFVRAGKYKGWEPMIFPSTSLSGKTIGIVGTGRIGERVAYYAKCLGLNIVYNNVNRNENFEKEYGAVFCQTLEELLPKSDFVSLHVPLLPTTTHLLNAQNFPLMKKSAFLINTSRGPVIDEKALAEALKGGVMAGAALDVFEFEPAITPELLNLPNVILTPHIASASLEARNEMAEIAAQNIIDFFEGKEVINKVNK